MHLHFCKYQGAGNDFILIDDRNASFPCNRSQLIQKLCHRKWGIGADGLILLQPASQPNQADCKMRIFNADGHEPAMCGNGVRCLTAFFRRLGFSKEIYRIETMHRRIFCEYVGERIRVSMGSGIFLHRDLNISLKEASFTVDVVDTGVPHIVFFVSDVEQIDVEKRGLEIQKLPLFVKEGVNVNFAAMTSDGKVQLRTYERGVGETLSCGTGAVAVAWISIVKHRLQNPVLLLPASKDVLEARVENAESQSPQLMLTGSADLIFEGKIRINDA